MKVNASYTKEDVSLIKTYLSPAVKTYQITEDAYSSILDTLKLFLNKKPEEAQENWLTVKETCQKLKITKPTLYKLINSGKLKKIKVGSSTRILESDVLRVYGR